MLVIDEVHERDIHSEFLLAVLKEKLLKGEITDLKLVLMTATLNHDIFIPFFKEVRETHGDGDAYSMLHFEGRCYPVKEYFLEDVLEWTDVELAGPSALSARKG